MTVFMTEARRYVPMIASVTIGMLLMMVFTTFFETGLQFEIDRITVGSATISFLAAAMFVHVRELSVHRMLYVNARMTHVRRLFLTGLVFFSGMLAVLVMGIAVINIKAAALSSSDVGAFVFQGIGQGDFVFVGRTFREIFSMILHIALNHAYVTLLVMYGFAMSRYRIVFGRSDTDFKMVMSTIVRLLLLQIVYRGIIFLLKDPLWMLDLNIVGTWTIFASRPRVWVDMLFIPAFVIYVLDSVRMVQNIKEMKTEHGRTVAVW
jgi:hypothetical protein